MQSLCAALSPPITWVDGTRSLATLAMTCGLAAMGAAYGRLLEAEDDGATSGRLLCDAVAVFLVASSLRTLFGQYPAAAKVRSRRARALTVPIISC